MKRTRSIRLVLIGGLSAGSVTGCGPTAPSSSPTPAAAAPSTIFNSAITTSAVFTNNHFVPGVGYYHAPFRAWYSLPYNYYNTNAGLYYAGSQWMPVPFASAINISSPTPEAVRQVEAQRTDIHRGGFGTTGHRSGVYS